MKNACPDQNLLQRFLDGALGQEQFHSVETHIDSCVNCEDSLASLVDNLVDHGTRSLSEREATVNSLVPHEIIDRIAGLLAVNATGESDQAELPIVEIAGTQLGDYQIVREIGRGGMGVIYLAEQTQPVKREVALKIIKPGRDTGEVLARFEAERQALAMMDHPNIARVLDAGATRSGRPYFVMELVNGDRITDFCDQRQLTTGGRMRLFMQVCRAIQHAHQKGIIHRDIKPSNVLVCESDGKFVVKVIDFGLAKATEQALTDRSFETNLFQVLGTPLYMSPEQVDLGSGDIDTRCDIYSLGVLLYELLTGSTPIVKQKFKQASHDEMRKMICEQEPDKPSDRVGSNGTVHCEISRNRKSNPRRLGQLLRGDLDWIVMMALEKDRDRRYDTANEFASDIERFLEDQPVLARPPSRRYQLQKFVYRNRVAVVASSLVAIALIFGIAGTTWGLIWALNERDRANIAVVAEKAAMREVTIRAKAESDAKQQAVEQADQLQQVSEFQVSQLSEIDVNKMGLDLRNGLLNEVRMALERTKVKSAEIDTIVMELDKRFAGVNFTNLSLKTLDANIFQRAMTTIDKDFAQQPLVQASLLLSVGSSRHQLGLLGSAIEPLERSLQIRRDTLGNDHSKTAESIHHMGMLAAGRGKFAQADALLREAIEISQRTAGRDHPETLNYINSLGSLLMEQGKLSEAESLMRAALMTSQQLYGRGSSKNLPCINNLGSLLLMRGNISEAEPLFGEALDISRNELGDESIETLACLSNLGALFHTQGKMSQAEPLFRESLNSGRRLLGDEHPMTLNFINNLGELLQRQGQLSQAEPLLRETLRTSRRVLGNEHPSTLDSVDNLGALLRTQAKTAEAESLFREALATRRHLLGEEHPKTMVSMSSLGSLLLDQDKVAEAEPLYRGALEVSRKWLGDEHPNTLVYINNLASLLKKQKNLAEAEPLFREALATSRSTLGDDHPNTLAYINNLAKLLKKLDELPEAKLLFREALETGRRVLGNEHPNTLVFIGNLGSLLEDTGEFDEAELLFREAFETACDVLGDEHPKTLKYIKKLGSLLAEQGKLSTADPLLRKRYEFLKETNRSNSDSTD